MVRIRGHGLRGLIIAACLAIAAPMAAFAERAVAFVDRLFAFDAVAAVRRLVGVPALAVEGFGGFRDQVEPSLLHRQRHEAGLARLGAVRHI